MNQTILRDVEILSKNLQDAKKNRDILKDRENEVLKALKTEHGISSKRELEKKIKENEEKINKLSADIQEKYDDIKKKYSW
jgi:hypothetical protein